MDLFTLFLAWFCLLFSGLDLFILSNRDCLLFFHLIYSFRSMDLFTLFLAWICLLISGLDLFAFSNRDLFTLSNRDLFALFLSDLLFFYHGFVSSLPGPNSCFFPSRI